MLLQLSLCVATLVHLTSSQSTYDVSDVSSCGASEQLLRLLVNGMSELRREVAELRAAIRQRETKACPATFTYQASVNGCYKVVTDRMDWSLAGLTCRSLHKDAHLLVINDENEQSAMEFLLISNKGKTSGKCSMNPEQGEFFWTAGQRIDPARNSTFIWRLKSAKACDEMEYAMTYTNWAPGQPLYIGEIESCMHLWTHQNLEYTWNDWICRLPACFICEIDLSA